MWAGIQTIGWENNYLTHTCPLKNTKPHFTRIISVKSQSHTHTELCTIGAFLIDTHSSILYEQMGLWGSEALNTH